MFDSRPPACAEEMTRPDVAGIAAVVSPSHGRHDRGLIGFLRGQRLGLLALGFGGSDHRGGVIAALAGTVRTVLVVGHERYGVLQLLPRRLEHVLVHLRRNGRDDGTGGDANHRSRDADFCGQQERGHRGKRARENR